MAQVVSGFPGVGKSWLRAKMLGVKDSDSSAFSWAPAQQGEPKKRNPYWPDNYIQYIQYHLSHPDTTYILVSSHQEVRDAGPGGHPVRARVPLAGHQGRVHPAVHRPGQSQ